MYQLVALFCFPWRVITLGSWNLVQWPTLEKRLKAALPQTIPWCLHTHTHTRLAGKDGSPTFLTVSLSMGNFLHHQHQRREIGHLPLPVSRKARASHSDGRGAATEQRGSVTTDYFHYFISGPKMLWFGARDRRSHHILCFSPVAVMPHLPLSIFTY